MTYASFFHIFFDKKAKKIMMRRNTFSNASQQLLRSLPTIISKPYIKKKNKKLLMVNSVVVEN